VLATLLFLLLVVLPPPPSLLLQSVLIITVLYSYMMAFMMTLSYWESARVEAVDSLA
jgi:hypothetical protein